MERWQEIEDLFYTSRQMSPGDRMGFLESACHGDAGLISEVSSLLDCVESHSQFLEKPALESTLINMNPSDAGSLIGRRLGSYEILELLGRGGMGEVYKAKDLNLGRIDALKILPPILALDPERLRRFHREAKAAASLSHQNIATIYSVGEEQGLRYIAMEYVDGRTLEAKIEGQPLPFATLLDFGSQLGNALAEAHSKGVIHRDLNPSNILVNPEGQLKVLDFGIAKISHTPELSLSSPGSPESATALGMIMGTLEYMSPEQLLGQKVDQRTDIFAFGALLYQMATGRVPFKGRNIAEIMEEILSSPASIEQVPPPGVTKELWGLILRCLDKNSENRYPSMLPILNELVDISNRPPGLQSPSTKRPVLRPFRLNRWNSIWIYLFSFVLVSLSIWTYASWNRWFGSSQRCLAIVLWVIDPSLENSLLKNRILQETLWLLSQEETVCVAPYEQVVKFAPETDSALEIMNQAGADLNLQLWLGKSPQPNEHNVTGICFARDGTVQWSLETTLNTEQFEPSIQRIVSLIQKRLSKRR